MRKVNKKQKIGLFIIGFLIIVFYYQIDYKRHFIFNKDKSKCFTVWERVGNNCYIIPGRYYWFLSPRKNYIKTVNHRNYIGVIWNTEDDYKYKISIYNDFEIIDLQKDIKVYSKTDSLLLDYNILDTLDVQRGKRISSAYADSLKERFDFNYIDLNRIYGIKIFDYQDAIKD